MSEHWFDECLRTQKLPDGRVAYLVELYETANYACFDVSVLDRKRAGLEIPMVGDPPAADGYITPWERI